MGGTSKFIVDWENGTRDNILSLMERRLHTIIEQINFAQLYLRNG